MVDINESSRTIKAKIVYYGPAVGGKTTNLRFLQDNAIQERRGMMISVNSTQERTILFDLLPLRTIGFRGYDLRLQVIGVAGQSMYAPSRKTALRDADGLVFVANSAVDRWEENLQTYGEMTQGLVAHGLDITEIPFVIQYNKRDLPESTPLEVMERGLNPRTVPSFPATARDGVGVLETFAAILEATVRAIAARHPHLELPSGLTPQAWTQVAIRGMFGRTSFGPDAPPAIPVPVKIQPPKPVKLQPLPSQKAEPRVIKISPGKGSDERLDNRSPEAVAESYAEASAELGIAVAEMREERDAAQGRLEETARALEVAHALLTPNATPEQGVMRVLSCLAEAAEATHATLLAKTPAGGLVAFPLPPLTGDPLLDSSSASDWLAELAESDAPVLREGAGDEVLGALNEVDPPFSAVLATPIRDSQKVFALAMLYFAGDMPLPAQERIDHVALLGRIFSAPLELGSLRAQSGALERLRYLARRSDASSAWAIAALSRGELTRESVPLGPLLAPLSERGVEVSVEPDVTAVSGPSDLLHLALLTLISGGERRKPGSVTVRGRSEEGRVRLDVQGPTAAEAEEEEEEAVQALAQWIVDTCCGGRFETSVDGGRAVHTLWLDPA